MPIERSLGKKCKYADACPLFHGVGIPDDMTQPIYRNVFCYRGAKGWSNCRQYESFEKENVPN